MSADPTAPSRNEAKTYIKEYAAEPYIPRKAIGIEGIYTGNPDDYKRLYIDNISLIKIVKAYGYRQGYFKVYQTITQESPHYKVTKKGGGFKLPDGRFLTYMPEDIKVTMHFCETPKMFEDRVVVMTAKKTSGMAYSRQFIEEAITAFLTDHSDWEYLSKHDNDAFELSE